MTPSDLDTLWLALCTVLVLLMQPGFTAIESGFVRAKNGISVAVKNIADLTTTSLIYWVIGYGLMFGATGAGWIGMNQFAFDGGGGGYSAVFFLFQLAFCGTAATIVSGAVAERMRFAAYVATAALLAAVIYPVTGHWAWNGLERGEANGWLASLGFIDFAGSTVVHGVGGWVALAAVLVVGPRIGRFDDGKQRIEGHDLSRATFGAFLLWIGWFGFNGGSTLVVSNTTFLVLINTTLSAAAAGVSVAALSYLFHRRLWVRSVINGPIAGLVAVTAAAHVVTPTGSVIIGLVAGAVLLAGDALLERLRIDDAVGAVPVHLFAGVWGTLAVALLGDPAGWGNAHGRGDQLLIQLVGIGAIGAYAFTAAFVLLWLLDRLVPVRVTAADERIGLNAAEHGASSALYDLVDHMEMQRRNGDFGRRAPVEPHTEAGQIAERYNLVLDRVADETRRREQAVEQLRRAKEEADAANHSKSQFLAAMSHELRTPLNAIIGFSEILNVEALGPLGNEKYKEYSGDILNSGNHLLSLVNDILDLSKIEAQRFELAEEEVETATLACSVVRLVEPRAMDQGITLETHVSADLPSLYVDRRAIRQVLLNLLSNAVKFTPPGGTVSLMAEVEGDGRMALSVSDTGIGMKRSDIPKALEPFGQIADTINAHPGGTGLGLPLARSLLTLHGGTLVISSQEGRGTTVVARLPWERVLIRRQDTLKQAG